MEPDNIGSESAFLTPIKGFPSEYCHDVWYRKTRMMQLGDSEKKIEDTFIYFDRIHECDRQTPHDGIGLA